MGDVSGLDALSAFFLRALAGLHRCGEDLVGGLFDGLLLFGDDLALCGESGKAKGLILGDTQEPLLCGDLLTGEPKGLLRGVPFNFGTVEGDPLKR